MRSPSVDEVRLLLDDERPVVVVAAEAVGHRLAVGEVADFEGQQFLHVVGFFEPSGEDLPCDLARAGRFPRPVGREPAKVDVRVERLADPVEILCGEGASELLAWRLRSVAHVVDITGCQPRIAAARALSWPAASSSSLSGSSSGSEPSLRAIAS